MKATFTIGKIKEVDLLLMYSREKDGDNRILYTFRYDLEKDGVKDDSIDEGIILIDKNQKDGKWYVGTIYHPNY